MEEYIINEDYMKILFDDDFLRTIIIRISNPEHNTNLFRAYDIPMTNLDFYLDNRQKEVMNVVNRLKDIEKDIDWNETILDGHTSEAISFMALLEAIAGKRNLNKLAYLVFYEMYI